MKKILSMILIGLLLVGLVAVSGCADTPGAEGAEKNERTKLFLSKVL